MANLTIIDGHSYLYGAFYGVPDQAKTKGDFRVDAVYGFIALLRVVVAAFPKNKIFVVFDSKKWIKDKKENKSLLEQLKLIQKLLTELNIRWIQHPVLKSDNIIASMAAYWAKNNGRVVISSSDFDFVQLISAKISLSRNLHGLITRHDAEFVKQKFGVMPSQYVDLQALIGDENDGIIGVRGIGQKTAVTLLNEYKNIDGIYKSIEKISKNISSKLKSNKALVFKNRKNIPMMTDIPVKDFFSGQLPDVNRKLVLEKTNTMLQEIGII